MKRSYDDLIGLAIDPDGETLKGKAFRFRCSPIYRNRVDPGRNYADFTESAHAEGPEALIEWIRKTLTPKETP